MKRKTTEQLTEDLENLLNRIYQSVDMEVARTIVETALDKTEKRRIEAVGNSKAFKILQMAKGLKSIGEIIEETQYAEASIYQIMRKEGIYSRKRVKQMLRQGKTPEEIAKEGNVNVDAVEKLSEELLKIEEQRKRTKKEKKVSPLISEVVRLTKNLESIDEIASKVPYTKANIYYIMRKRGIYSREKVEKLIKEGKTPEEIAQEGNVNIDAVVRFKSEIEETREDAKTDDIIEAAKSLTRVKKITEKFQVTQSHVRNITDKEGIYSRRKVKQLIEEGKTLEEIAREGNVYLEAVIKFKKEIENKRHKKTNEEEKASNVSRIIELAKSLKNINKISKEAQYSKRYIYQIMRQEGIYTVGKVKQLIEEGKTPEEIAQEGNVNLDAVIKLREELEKSGKGKIEKGKTPKVEKIIELAKDLKSVTEIAKEVQSIRSYVYQIIGREGIYSKSKVEQLIEEGKAPEEIAQEGNVNLDAVIRLKAEMEESIENAKTKEIIESAKSLMRMIEITEKFQVTKSCVRNIMDKKGIYTRNKVKQLIKEGKTPEEIAEEGNVYLDAVIKFKKKIASTIPKETNEGREESPKINTSKTSRIIELAKDLKPVDEIVKEVQCINVYVYQIIGREGIYSRRKVKQLIEEGKTPEEIAKEGNVNLDAVIRFINEPSHSKKRKTKIKDSDVSRIVEMARNLKSKDEIMRTLQISISYVNQIMRQEGIYSRKKVGQLIIEGKTDKQIATEGNVNLEAVKELREEIEIVAHTKPQETMETQPKKVLPRRRTIPQTDQPTSIKYQSQSRQSTSQESQDIGKSETDKKILSLARKLVSVEAIVSALGIPEYTIRNKLIKNNILPRERIISLINQGEKTDAEIAAESGCNVQAIETLRNEISNLRQIVNRNSKYKMAIEMLEKGESDSKISVTLKLKMQHIRQLEELLVTKKEQTTDSKRKGIEFNIEITKLRASINTMQHSSRVQAESTDYKIQRILYKYPELLGRREYAFFAYAYSKVGEYLKAIELGEEYLELDTPSISALQKKIKEVLEEEKSKQTENQSAVALSGANLGEAETGATRTVKIGQTVGDSEGDEHSGR